MKKYDVEFELIGYRNYTVQAPSADEAERMAWELHKAQVDVEKEDWQLAETEEIENGIE